MIFRTASHGRKATWIVSSILIFFGLSKLGAYFFRKLALVVCVMVVCFSIQTTELTAYPYDDSLSTLPTSYSKDGLYTRADGTVEDYTIPIEDWGAVIHFIVRGGDGGRAKSIATVGEDLASDGGGGALLRTRFDVDPYADKALRPGGEIRLIIGSRGQNKTRNHSAGSGGGGGTAVLYRAPIEGAPWEMLAVAGGGGGAATSAHFNDTFSQEGLNANTGGDGDNGRLQGSGDSDGQPGGTAGSGGQTANDGSSGGGGGYKGHSYDQYGEIRSVGGDGGGLVGGSGGSGEGYGSWGGFGFGGGGGGYVNDNDSVSPTVAKGGGGGGYSGGGAGGNHNNGDGAGGGAGSYIDNWSALKIAETRNSENLDGNVTLYAVSLNPTGVLPGPVFSEVDGEETIWDYEVGNYSHGVTVTDVYGNELGLVADSWNTTNGPGTYVLNFSATDQFGKTSSTTKTITVILAPGPAFSEVDGEETIWDYEAENYSHGVTATDVFGNELEMTADSWDSTNGPGTYVLNFSATDQFGKTNSTTKTITVIRGNKPTFAIYGDIGVLEDSEEFTWSFVSNARTNDSSQTVINYTVDSDNPDLFASDGLPEISRSGRLSFTPADNANGTANVTVIAVDNANDPVNGSSDPQYFKIRVVGLADPPTLTRQTGTNFDENTNVAISFTAQEPFGNSINYTLTGVDASLFSFDADTLILSLTSVPNFEAPVDHDSNNRYHVSLTATGSDGETTQNLEIRVANLEEAPTPPVLSNSSVLENTTAVGTVSSNDPDGGSIVYGLSGVDAALFNLNSTTGELTFINAPDYENPLDADGNRGYEISITATDSAQAGISTDVTVSVRNESSALTTPTLNNNVIVEGNTLIGTLFSEGESGEILSFNILGGADSSAFEIIGNTLNFKNAPDFENALDQNGDNVYEVHLVSLVYDFESPLATFSVSVVSENNQPPSAPELSNDTIEENIQIVGELSTTDSNGDLILISITGGADAHLFEIINGNTLAFIEAPNFDSPVDANGDNQYEVHVSASDPAATSAESLFSITVQNLTDEPAIDILLNGESVTEISLEENLVGDTIIATITAVDLDPADSNTFKLTTSSSGRFKIVNGNELAVTGNPQLDHEADDYHSIRIESTDTVGLTYVKKFGVRVSDVDETSILKREGYTLDTNTNYTWLNPDETDGKKVSVVEGRIERGEVFGEGYDWQLATWDEYIQFLKNSSTDWTFDIQQGYWAFLFEDDYFDHDGTSIATPFENFDMLALNRDGSYGRNLGEWYYDYLGRPRVLAIYPLSQSSIDFRQEFWDEGTAFVLPDSPEADQSRLHLEGAPNTQNRIDIYLIVDRTSGVGFDGWATGQERSTYFDQDDNGDGKPVGLDYVFGDEKPMQMLATNQIKAPANLWSDVEIRLQVSSDLSAGWTTIVHYQGGALVEQDPSVTIENNIITYGDADSHTAVFYRYSVEPMAPSEPE